MHSHRATIRALAPATLLATALLVASCSSLPFIGQQGDADPPPTGPAAGSLTGEHIPSGQVVSNGAAITKVKYFHLDTLRVPATPETSIPFETRYHIHGAITRSDILERYGHYYSIFWELENPSAPVTLRFEYRQRTTGPAVKVIDVPVESPERKNLTKLQITGDAYLVNGSVSAWRVTVLRGDALLASDQSFLWE
ncbi:hypothetical protein BH23VER1_BH23VER1_06820 [soil metagenome]